MRESYGTNSIQLGLLLLPKLTMNTTTMLVRQRCLLLSLQQKMNFRLVLKTPCISGWV